MTTVNNGIKPVTAFLLAGGNNAKLEETVDRQPWLPREGDLYKRLTEVYLRRFLPLPSADATDGPLASAKPIPCAKRIYVQWRVSGPIRSEVFPGTQAQLSSKG
jgi:hypothetical protein